MKKIFLVVAIIFSGILYISAQQVQWLSFEDAVEKNKKEPRKFMVDVYTDWCKWCKVMDANTFSHPVIANYLNENYYPVKFNAEQKDNITVNGQVFKFIPQGSRGYHELAAQLLNGQLSFPSVVFLNEELQIITPVPGYTEAKQFDPMLKFIAGEHYKTSTWEKFSSTYQSPVN